MIVTRLAIVMGVLALVGLVVTVGARVLGAIGVTAGAAIFTLVVAGIGLYEVAYNWLTERQRR